jgi:hypothetical protein
LGQEACGCQEHFSFPQLSGISNGHPTSKPMLSPSRIQWEQSQTWILKWLACCYIP